MRACFFTFLPLRTTSYANVSTFPCFTAGVRSDAGIAFTSVIVLSKLFCAQTPIQRIMAAITVKNLFMDFFFLTKNKLFLGDNIFHFVSNHFVFIVGSVIFRYLINR